MLGCFPWPAAVLLGHAVLTTAMKRLCIRHFGWH
jgi:hypothetical protein